MNFYALDKEFRQIKKRGTKPAIIATTPEGPIEISPRDLLDCFFEAIRDGCLSKTHLLYETLAKASEDKDQGLIFGCLRKLAQGLEPIRGEDLYLPRGKQAKSILESTKRLNIWYGSVRSSKTVMTCIKWLYYSLRGPKGHLMMVGQTLDTLELNVLEVIRDLLPVAIAYTHGWTHCILFGRKIWLRSANDVGQEKKFRGPTLAGAYCDEITTWPKQIWKMLLTRLSKAGASLFGTTNPDQPLHYLNVDVIERAKELSCTLWHFVLDDNPGLTDEYKADLVRENPPGTVYYLRFILGLWVAAEGRVYNFLTTEPKDGFVVDDLPKDLRRWQVHIDYGQTHPTCMGLFAYSPSQKCWYLVKEFYTNGKTNTVYAQEFDREMLYYEGKQIFPEFVDVDPGGGGKALIEELRAKYPHLENAGIIGHAIKADVSNEIQELASALFNHLFRIYRKCSRIIAEMMSYLWDEKKAKEEPIKQNDDGCDVCRYAWNRIQRA